MLVDFQPNPKRRLDSGREKTERIERCDPITEQFKQSRGRTEARSSKMNWQHHPMEKPRRNRSCAKKHARISGEQQSPERRSENKDGSEHFDQLIDVAAENVARVKFERDPTRNSA